jgi:hypothetical protein
MAWSPSARINTFRRSLPFRQRSFHCRRQLRQAFADGNGHSSITSSHRQGGHNAASRPERKASGRVDASPNYNPGAMAAIQMIIKSACANTVFAPTLPASPMTADSSQVTITPHAARRLPHRFLSVGGNESQEWDRSPSVTRVAHLEIHL